MDAINESQVSNGNEAHKDTYKTSNLKSNASQCYATFATNLIKLTSGSMIGFTAVLIAELYKEDAEIYMSVDDLTWFSSRYFMTPVGSLLFGIVAHKIGNRLTMLIASILYIVSCLIFYLSTSRMMLMSAQVLVGLTIPISSGVGNTYVVEITQPHLRSALTACTSLSIVVASFFILTLSNFFQWRLLVLIILVLPIIGFIALCTIPESPHWLANKGKLKQAKSALAWLRGWTTPSKVIPEFDKIKENVSLNSECPSETEDISNSNNTFCLRDWLEPYLQRSFYVPLASICCIFIVQDMAGFHVLETFLIVIFDDINAPIDPHVSGSIFVAARILGSLVFIASVNYIGKKKLVYISLITAAFSYLTVSIVLFLRDYRFHPEICQWIAAITMIISIFSTSFGIDKTVYILNTELFPTKLRNIGSGMGLFVFYITGSISNKLFLYVSEILTLPGIFVIFSIACVVNCIMFYAIIPETEGRTLKEIEDHFNGINKLKK